jgi:Ca2+-binding RTX toxin-like protein
MTRWSMSRGARTVVLAVCSALLVTAATGTLASNVVATSRLGRFSKVTGANDLKPLPECAGIALSVIDAGSGSFNASNSDELIVGSAGADSIGARNGDDCVVAGAGNDTINGGVGNDVCIGGLGTDTFNACETTIQ